METQFFSEADYSTQEGIKKVASEYPAWYYNTMVDDLKEDIRREEFALESGVVPGDRRPQILDKVKRLKKKYDEILDSFPKLAEPEELGKEISSRMFTRSQMQKGLADSHTEARRMVEPSITITPEVAEVAVSCNITPRDGKISRNEAEKIWKITSRYFGETSNSESLRRD
jgi:hypothetical protein